MTTESPTRPSISKLLATEKATHSVPTIDVTQSTDDVLSTSSIPIIDSDMAFVSNITGYSTDEKASPRGFFDDPSNVALASTLGVVSAFCLAGLIGCICATIYKAAVGSIKRFIIAIAFYISFKLYP